MNDLTQGKESSVILKFAMPMLLGNLFQQTYNFVDSIIVGRLIGDEALAAVGASFPVIFALISFVVGIATGGTIVIAQYYGAKDYKQVKKAVDTILIFTLSMSVLIMVLGMVFSRKIFEITGLPADIIPYATIYLNTFLSGTILLFGFNGVSAILKGTGDSKTPLYFLVAASALNILLDFIFIKYFHWGVRGAALATVFAHGLVFIAAALYLNKTNKLIRISFSKMTFDKKIFIQSIRIGLPSGLQQTFVSFAMIALYIIVNHFDTPVITAYSAAGRIDNLAMLPAMSFGQALSTFVGQNIGAGKFDRVRRGFISTLLISFSISLFIAILVFLARYPLMKLFTDSSLVISTGAGYLVIVCIAYVIFSIMYSINGVLRGSGATLVPMFITLFSLWIIRVPVASLLTGRFYIFAEKTGWHINLPDIFKGELAEKGVWLAVPISWAVGAFLSFIYYKTGKWRNKCVIN